MHLFECMVIYKDFTIDIRVEERDGKWFAAPKITKPDGSEVGPYAPLESVTFLSENGAREEAVECARREIDELISLSKQTSKVLGELHL